MKLIERDEFDSTVTEVYLEYGKIEDFAVKENRSYLKHLPELKIENFSYEDVFAKKQKIEEEIERQREELEKQRMQEIELLSSVIADSDAAQEAKESALNQKTQIAARMEREAQIHAIMEAMGVKGALAVSGAQGITLLLPTETAQDETLRNRLIYAAASQTGVEEKDIQIILIKK